MNRLLLLPAAITDRGLSCAPAAPLPEEGEAAGPFDFRFEIADLRLPALPPSAADRLPQAANADGCSMLPAPACDPARDSLANADCGLRIAELPPSPRPLRACDFEDGLIRREAVLFAREQFARGATWREIARRGRHLFPRHASLWFKLCQSVQDIPNHLLTAEQCAPRSRFSGPPPVNLPLTEGEVAVVRGLVAATNLTWDRGSIPVALRAAAKRGLLRPEIVALIEFRERKGRTLLPQAQLRRLRVAPVAIRAGRAPRRTWIETVSSDGSLRMTRDANGGERLLGAGERLTIDDATLNLGCVVPGLQRRGDPCYDKFGVCVGRFQILVVVDQATDYIAGWSYTARPKGSYRSEDLAATILECVQELGLPRELIREQGISGATQFNRALTLAGVKVIVAKSPHQKAVESVFNRVWTLLSLLPGQVGRWRGEEEAMGRIYEACKAGGKDPRDYFLELPALLAAVETAVAEHNGKRIHSPGLYGDWVPRETFAKEAPAWLRPFPENEAWMFAPVVRTLTVRGHAVRTPVELMEDFRVKLTLAHPGLGEFDGRPVTVFFNPLAEVVTARCVTEANVGEWRAGTLLPFTLEQTNWVANAAHRALGYGPGRDIGQAAASAASRALVRTTRVVRPDGVRVAPRSVVRDAQGNEAVFGPAERGTRNAELPVAAGDRPERGGEAAIVRRVRGARAAFAPVSEDDFAERRARRERREAALAVTAG